MALKEEVIDAICRRIAGGESLRSICRDDDMPALSTVTMWISDGTQPDFSDRYHAAREAAAHAHADQLHDIAAKLERGEITPAAAKVLTQAYQWSAERMSKAYSGRTVQDHQSTDGSMSPTQRLSDDELDDRITRLMGGD